MKIMFETTTVITFDIMADNPFQIMYLSPHGPLDHHGGTQQYHIHHGDCRDHGDQPRHQEVQEQHCKNQRCGDQHPQPMHEPGGQPLQNDEDDWKISLKEISQKFRQENLEYHCGVHPNRQTKMERRDVWAKVILILIKDIKIAKFDNNMTHIKFVRSNTDSRRQWSAKSMVLQENIQAHQDRRHHRLCRHWVPEIHLQRRVVHLLFHHLCPYHHYKRMDQINPLHRADQGQHRFQVQHRLPHAHQERCKIVEQGQAHANQRYVHSHFSLISPHQGHQDVHPKQTAPGSAIVSTSRSSNSTTVWQDMQRSQMQEIQTRSGSPSSSARQKNEKIKDIKYKEVKLFKFVKV